MARKFHQNQGLKLYFPLNTELNQNLKLERRKCI